MSESMFEMDRRIRELEHAISANDEYLQKVEALNAELLTALKHARLFVSQPTPLSAEIDELIAKARFKGAS